MLHYYQLQNYIILHKQLDIQLLHVQGILHFSTESILICVYVCLIALHFCIGLCFSLLCIAVLSLLFKVYNLKCT